MLQFASTSPHPCPHRSSTAPTTFHVHLNAACHSRDPFACLDTIRLPYERGCMSDPARADDQTAEPAAQTLQKDEKKNSFLETIRFRSEEHTSELQSLMRISYAVFCL